MPMWRLLRDQLIEAAAKAGVKWFEQKRETYFDGFYRRRRKELKQARRRAQREARNLENEARRIRKQARRQARRGPASVGSAERGSPGSEGPKSTDT